MHKRKRFKIRDSGTYVIRCVPNTVSNSTLNLFASRCRIRKTGCTKAKISKYHILESRNTGRDICYKILNTNLGPNEHYENINYDNIIPILSPIMELFKKRHNRFNYRNELKSVVERSNRKKVKQKYKNQIHVHLLQSFFNLTLYKNIPLELFGTTKNLKVIKKTMGHLLKSVPKKILIQETFKRSFRKKDAIGASLDISPLLHKIDSSKIKWLHPINNIIEKNIIILKLLRWLFTQYIIKILHKYVVLISVKNRWVYIAKNDWCKMQEEFIKEKQSSYALIPWSAMELKKSTWNIPIGIYKFIPSSSGLRPLLIVKYNIKEKFDDMDIVLRFLQQLYITKINKDGMPTVSCCIQAVSEFKKSTKNRLYFVRCDIQDAFGSILQEKLYKIICMYSKILPDYLALRTYTIPKNKTYKKNINQLGKKFKRQTVQFVSDHLMKLICKNSVMNDEKPTLIRKRKLFSKINKLIFEQKVRLDNKVYSIKLGIPQGLMVSPILSNIYYQHIFKEVFSEYESDGRLCTYVDDILYLTENEYRATKFLEIIKNGISQYKIKFNPNKIQSNIGTPYKFTKVRFLGYNITL